ncbi:hypothetical protein DFH11DRAFT_1543547 [Phellopilus nigrolimitatus]|nr:hypothetical protein DFH11DRAFT_1543547 [Phellopilus nigrolimitatus]
MKLNNLAELIAKLRSTVGLLLFVVLLIRFFVQLSTGDLVRSVDQKGLAFVQILIISLTLALAPAMKCMTHENLLVRVLDGCETTVNASVGCTDKMGMLVQNMLSIIMGSVGIHVKFVPGIHEYVLSPALRRLFNDALTGNSTALEDEDGKTSTLRCMPTHYLRCYRTRRQPTGECKQEGSGGQWWHAQDFPDCMHQILKNPSRYTSVRMVLSERSTSGLPDGVSIFPIRLVFSWNV